MSCTILKQSDADISLVSLSINSIYLYMRLVVDEAVMRGSSLHLFSFLLLMIIPHHNMCDSPDQETHYNIISHKYRASSLIQHLDGYKMTELCFIYCVILKNAQLYGAWTFCESLV